MVITNVNTGDNISVPLQVIGQLLFYPVLWTFVKSLTRTLLKVKMKVKVKIL